MFLIVDVILRLGEFVHITEGGIQEICMTVDERRERDVYVLFSVIPSHNTSCKLLNTDCELMLI